MSVLSRSAKPSARLVEATAVTLTGMIALLGFLSAAAAAGLQQGQSPVLALPGALLPALLIAASLAGFHFFLRSRRLHGEQLIWPCAGLLFVIGAVMIGRLRGADGVAQQLLRGWFPGLILAGLLVARPQWIEAIRRRAPLIGLVGLALPIATSLFGTVDETGARLALKLGPLPAVQTSELIKLAMIIFLAWYVEGQGSAAEGRARPFLGWLRIPALPYFIPGVLFVAVATLALVNMSDYGAVLILGSIFVAMLYAGFDTRLFIAVTAIALVLAGLAGLILAATWEVPAVIQYRFMAFLDPWSTAPLTLNGQPTGISISEGPGYQIQQAVYAVIAGGITGRGLGFGSPDYVPLAHSDFILAAVVEEYGAVIGVAVLFLFAVLLLRVFRAGIQLPRGQVFERLLVVGIGAHLFTQVFVMAGGTLNLLPVTGVTIPFLSQGGMALLTNLVEIGLVLAIVRRMEGLQPASRPAATPERRVWMLARVTTVLLVLVSLRIVYWQLLRGDLQPVAVDLVQAAEAYAPAGNGSLDEARRAVEFLTGVSTVRELESLPRPVIQRTMDLLETIQRGAIYDRRGRRLAYDQPALQGAPSGDTGEGTTRIYTEPSLVHTLGYVSGLRTGVTGLELRYNTTLLGLDRPDARIAMMLHKPVTGSDLVLTIDRDIQRAAEEALGGRPGAVIALDAASGAILAIASAPRFDPNRVLDADYTAGLLEGCEAGTACQAPFLNRAAQALYPPGSTWKTVALIAALDSGQVTPGTWFDFGEPVRGDAGPYYVYEVDGFRIVDPNHTEDRLDLEMAYAKSANAAFARIGDEMPPEVLIEYAGRFGFGSPDDTLFVPMDVEYNPAQLARDPRSLYDDNLLRAVTAIGQGELLSSPLTMGMVILSVWNEGRLPAPYLVQAVQEPGGRRIEDLSNRRTLEGLMKPATAQQVRQMMLRSVEEGGGKNAQVPGALVGGKTGTAQLGGDQAPHSWFAGFAEKEGRGVVVVVLVENGGQGSQVAAPIFARVAGAALTHLEGPAGEKGPATPPTPTTPETPPPDETPEAAVTAPPAEAPTATPPLPSATPTATPVQEGVLPPDIPRDPDRSDITAANPSCADLREMPEATGEFIWPSPYQALSGGDFKESHPGLDLSTPPGSPVHAADTGLVIFAGWSGAGYGNAVLIDHGNGYQTLYAHLSQVSIYCGAKVQKGKLIGLSGSTGNSTGPHLHFEVRVPGGYVDPLKVLPLP